MVSQVEIDAAREQDTARLQQLKADLLETLTRLFGMPDSISMDECKDFLDELEVVRAECAAVGNDDAAELHGEIEHGSETLVAAMRAALGGDVRRLEAFDLWRQAASAAVLAQSPAVLEILGLPVEEIVPTVCSFEPLDIASVVQACEHSDASLENLRVASLEVFTNAIKDGFPPSTARERLCALGVRPPF